MTLLWKIVSMNRYAQWLRATSAKESPTCRVLTVLAPVDSVSVKVASQWFAGRVAGVSSCSSRQLPPADQQSWLVPAATVPKSAVESVRV